MYFILSKILWTILQPSSLIALFLIFGLLVLPFRKRLGNWLLMTSAIFYLVCGLSPLSSWLLIPLEARVHAFDAAEKNDIAGIIVLGGSVDTITSAKRGAPQINEAAERMFETVRLAGIYPSVPVIFSGGDGEIVYSDTSEAAVAEQFFAPFGLSKPRLQLEDKSRNTHENAVNTAALLKPRRDQKWILITSAFHMPRSKAQFEASGFAVLPWPVDYRTRGRIDRWRIYPQPSEGLRRVDLAVKEWVSLIVSWAKGDIAWPTRDKGRSFIRNVGPAAAGT